MNRCVLFALITVVPQLGAAQSMVCGGRIINEGVAKAEVASACGPPTEVVRRSGALAPAVGEVTPPSTDDGAIEVWLWLYQIDAADLV